ncbi:MAG TPA: hypothetical protein VLB83_00095 [Candidatus Paceibacterota bacterium]|nr:hypothetical protein [Candidatus Paceibacterota bacterium]
MMKGMVRLIMTIAFLLSPFSASAVLPPDLLFSVGSTFAQWFSVAAALVAGVLASTLPFARAFWERVRSSRTLATVLALSVLAAMFGAGMAFGLSRKAALPLSTPILSTASTTEHVEFFADDIVLVAPESPFGAFAMDLSLNRKQEADGTFTHYAYADLRLGTSTFGWYDIVRQPDGELAALGEIDRIARMRAADLSARASLSGSLRFGPHQISFEVPELSGDFLIKDLPEYVKHASVARARVTIDGQAFDANIYAAHIASSDYRPYVFFPAYDSMHADARQFLLWDTDGNFFLADRTDVVEAIPAYPSHEWTLFHGADGRIAKGRTIAVEGSMTDPGSSTWTISGSDAFDPDIRLSLGAPYRAQPGSWYAEGEAATVGPKARVFGVAHVERIRPRADQ